MNPNYLRREEIEYELRVRGLNVTGDVNLLRKVSRSVVTEMVSVNLENLGGHFDPQEHIEYISSKVQELEVLLEKSVELAAIGPRVRTHVRHCLGRLTTLLNWSILPEDLSVSAIKELIVRLEAVERRLQHSSRWTKEGTVAESMTQFHTRAAQTGSKDDVIRHVAHKGSPALPHLFWTIEPNLPRTEFLPYPVM
jgi:hypothetical protein